MKKDRTSPAKTRTKKPTASGEEDRLRREKNAESARRHREKARGEAARVQRVDHPRVTKNLRRRPPEPPPKKHTSLRGVKRGLARERPQRRRTEPRLRGSEGRARRRRLPQPYLCSLLGRRFRSQPRPPRGFGFTWRTGTSPESQSGSFPR